MHRWKHSPVGHLQNPFFSLKGLEKNLRIKSSSAWNAWAVSVWVKASQPTVSSVLSVGETRIFFQFVLQKFLFFYSSEIEQQKKSDYEWTENHFVILTFLYCLFDNADPLMAEWIPAVIIWSSVLLL